MTFQDKSRAYGKDVSFDTRKPHDDSFDRSICNHCGLINYENPKIIAGVVATWEDKILMCRRAIEPRINFWTLPAGFMEKLETVQQAAAREAQEEACADVEVDTLIGIYNVARISQVQMFFRGKLRSPDIAVGPESAEVAMFSWDEIPWKELAFPSVYWALQHFQETKDQAQFAPFSEPADWLSTPGFEGLRRP